MKYLFLILSIFIFGCDISNLDKAKQDAVCEGHGGAYEYVSLGYVECKDGLSISDREWTKFSGDKVEQNLRKIQNGTKTNKN